METNLYIEIYESMQDDDEAPERISERIVCMYENANPDQKTTIDQLLTTLCGWGYETLLETVDQKK